MRFWMGVLVALGLLLPVNARAQSANRDAIRAVISKQIDAFRRDDGGEAFAFASPNIQAMLGDAEAFMRMVRTGYPMVYRPARFSFSQLVMREGKWVQLVEFIGRDGATTLAAYEMVRIDGVWRINGCEIIRRRQGV